MGCNSKGDCVAIRNKNGNNASIVTKKTVTNYIAGKKSGLSAATKLVEKQSGGIFTAKTWDTRRSHDPYGANAALQRVKDPNDMIKMVQSVMVKNGYKYVLVGSGYSNLARNENDVASKCSQFEIASFMLGMETGCFLICQGWDNDFAKPLGDPLGPAAIANGVMSRSFASGTNVSWVLGSKKVAIQWANEVTNLVV